MALAGFTSAEAEGLRRAMSRKRSEEAIARAPRPLRRRRRRAAASPRRRRSGSGTQIQGFSGFGFPKAHSAAFGLLAYQSAWLRIHYAPEFLCALLNEQPMGFYPPDALAHEAQRRGVRVGRPDVNRSRVLCHVERERGAGSLVRIGLGYVKGVREEEMESLVAERERGGPYRGVADLASRSGAGPRRPRTPRLGRRPRTAVASAGGTGGAGGRARRSGRWAVRAGAGGSGEGTQLALPLEPPPAPELEPLGEWEETIADYRSTGMTLGEHPMALMRDEPRAGAAAQHRPGAGRRRQRGRGGGDGRRPPAPGDRQGDRLHAARGRARHRQPDRAAAGLRAPPRRGPHRRPASAPRAGSSAAKARSTSSSPRWPSSSPRQLSPAGPARSRREAPRRRSRARAVEELRAVIPAGHSFGRRGR